VHGLERLAATCSHAELVQSAEDLETMRRLGIPDRRLHLLGNGVDLTRFTPGSVSDEDRRAARAEMGAHAPDDVVVGCVARMVTEKGIPELIEAAVTVMEACPRVRFALISTFAVLRGWRAVRTPWFVTAAGGFGGVGPDRLRRFAG
jgi:glycosyltransferase involved in cell wall biosynthesis